MAFNSPIEMNAGGLGASSALTGLGGGSGLSGLTAFGGVPAFGIPAATGGLSSLGLGQTVPGLGGDLSNLSPESQQSPQGQQEEMMMLMMMIEELMQELQQMQQQQQGGQGMGGGDSDPFTNGGGTGDGGGGGGSPIGGGGGGGGGCAAAPMGGGGGGGSSEGGSGGPVGQTPSTATGSPSQAVQIANQYLGQGSGSFTFANYTHAGGTGNDCADFVSACVADAGTFKKTAGDANVGTFQTDLQHQGWTATTSPQPGDVAIVNGSQHAELVSGPNGQCIGSNGGATNQTVSHDTPSTWGSVVYWQPPKQS